MKYFDVTERDGAKFELGIKQPSFQEIDEANSIYSSKVAELIREKGNKKLLLRQEVESFLRENNIWTDKDEQRIDALQKDIDSLLNKLRKGGEKAINGRKYCIQIKDKRQEIVDLWRKRQSIDNSTIESAAEADKLDYLIYLSTVDKEGKKHWESFEDLQEAKDTVAYAKASGAAFEVFLGIDRNIEKNLPENKWLKRYSFLDDSMHYVDRKSGVRVDRDYKPLVDVDTFKEIEEEKPFLDDDETPIIFNVDLPELIKNSE